MGQRSQIYVRYNGDLIIANYYQWNFAERMISRARYGIEWLKEYLDNGWNWMFKDAHYIRKISRIFDVNFDMKDVAISLDIMQEYREYGEGSTFCGYVFNQDNNDGQFLVDIVGDRIFYCFKDVGEYTPMDAEGYMRWEYRFDDKNDWEKDEYISEEGKVACKENIKRISEMATLMTEEQVREFVNADYESDGKQIKPF
jgi:hypothetical protein